MNNPKIALKAEEILTLTVGSRKTGSKNSQFAESLYIPINRETARALKLERGEVLTLAIVKRVKPEIIEETQPSSFSESS